MAWCPGALNIKGKTVFKMFFVNAYRRVYGEKGFSAMRQRNRKSYY